MRFTALFVLFNVFRSDKQVGQSDLFSLGLATNLEERKLNSDELYTAKKLTVCRILVMDEEVR